MSLPKTNSLVVLFPDEPLSRSSLGCSPCLLTPIPYVGLSEALVCPTLMEEAHLPSVALMMSDSHIPTTGGPQTDPFALRTGT